MKNSNEEVENQIEALAFLTNYLQEETNVIEGYGTSIEQYLLL